MNYKRTGDADSARNSLLASKQLEARAQELLQAAAAKTPGAPDPRLALAQRRLTDYKQAALAAKNAGDLSRARDMLVTSKKIAEAIDGGLPAGWELPTPPSSRPAAKPANAGSVSARLVPKPQSASAPKGQGLGTTSLPDDTPPPSIPTDLPGYLLTSLRNQITACTNASAFAFKRGDKQTALHFHKLKKLFTTDLATIEALKNSGAPPPPFRTETVSYKLERQNGDLEPGECEVAIIRCEGLVAKDVKASDLDVACTFDFGYPVENDATKPEGKGETPAQRGPDPVFDFTKTVPIDRTSRALIRHFEKRKLAIELYHNRGWFRGRALIARASISLSDLLSKCEIHELAPLTDPANPRRAIGGRIEVKVRLRTPARGPEVVEVVERWVSLDVGDGRDAVTVPRATTPVPADLPVTSVATPQKAAPLADMNIVQAPSPARGGPAVAAQPLTPIPATPPAPRTPPSVSSTQPPVQTAQSAEEIDDLIASFDSADGLASNAVVEHEMQLADARFAGAKTSTEKEEAADRKNALKIRETVLVTMVQTGKLTMDGKFRTRRYRVAWLTTFITGYLAQLQVAIADCKKMALRFKGMQRLDYAKKALERAKLMEREAAEVEEMIRSEAGEG